MGDLMISIMAMSDTDTTCPLSITNGKYNCIAHLTYISAFIDKIEPYLKDAVRCKVCYAAMCGKRSHGGIGDAETIPAITSSPELS